MDKANLTETQLENELDRLMAQISALAEESHSDSFLLLAILRKLEQTHRKIREEIFEVSLPNTRHHLYLLLRHIEETGGWPYLERMKLHNLCENYLKSDPQE